MMIMGTIQSKTFNLGLLLIFSLLTNIRVAFAQINRGEDALHPSLRYDITGYIAECEIEYFHQVSEEEKENNKVLIELKPEWSPLGAQRVLDLIQDEFYNNIALFRALRGFIVQFGLSGLKEKNHHWNKMGVIMDDPKPSSLIDHRENGLGDNIFFHRGYLSFAGSGKNSRGTQIFITFEDTDWLGRNSPWETPFGRVIKGMNVMDKIYTGYGEKPNQGRIQMDGEKYLKETFPQLSYIKECKLLSDIAKKEGGLEPLVKKGYLKEDVFGDGSLVYKLDTTTDNDKLRGNKLDSNGQKFFTQSTRELYKLSSIDFDSEKEKSKTTTEKNAMKNNNNVRVINMAEVYQRQNNNRWDKMKYPLFWSGILCLGLIFMIKVSLNNKIKLHGKRYRRKKQNA